MERLTERDGFGNADIIDVDSADLQLNLDFEEFNRVTDALNRLAAYEDTGLTPEDVKAMYDTVAEVGAPLWKIKELWQADAEGRLFVLPCDAAVVLAYKGRDYSGDHWNPPLLTAFADDPTTPSGKRVHLFTPEEAAAALAAMEE